MKKRKFFSISADLLIGGRKSPVEIFINSSTLEGREKFVRIHHRGKLLEGDDIKNYVTKYHQLYALESQRKLYLKEVFNRVDLQDKTKVEVMKDVAISHLKLLFESHDSKSGENLFENEVLSCRDSIYEMIDFLSDTSLTSAQKILGDIYTHDSYTYDHSVNVAFYSIIFLKFINKDASKEELLTIGLSGLFHDLGKRKISTSLLNFSGKLSDEQFDKIKKHPQYGMEVFSSCGCNGLSDDSVKEISRVILEHHENVNGTGYPKGLSSESISDFAKMVAITDFFDAVTSYRSYHEPLSNEDALNLMENSVERKIDKEFFQKFKKCVGEVISKGRTFFELPDDFDPCQPHKVLPFKKREAKIIKKDIFNNLSNTQKEKKAA